jgi:hypothetical protein
MRTDHLHPAVVVASNRYSPLVKLADMPLQRVNASAADPGGTSSTTAGASSTRTRSLALAMTMRDAHPPGFWRASMSDHPAGAATHGDAVEPVRVAVYGSRAVAEGAHPTIVTRRQVQPIPARSHFISILSTTTLRGCGPRGSTQRSRDLRILACPVATSLGARAAKAPSSD